MWWLSNSHVLPFNLHGSIQVGGETIHIGGWIGEWSESHHESPESCDTMSICQSPTKSNSCWCVGFSIPKSDLSQPRIKPKVARLCCRVTIYMGCKAGLVALGDTINDSSGASSASLSQVTRVVHVNKAKIPHPLSLLSLF